MTGELFATIQFRRDRSSTPTHIDITARIKPDMEGTPYNDAFKDLIKLDQEFLKTFRKYGFEASFFVEYRDNVEGVD